MAELDRTRDFSEIITLGSPTYFQQNGRYFRGDGHEVRPLLSFDHEGNPYLELENIDTGDDLVLASSKEEVYAPQAVALASGSEWSEARKAIKKLVAQEVEEDGLDN